MFKILSVALIAASFISSPVLAGSTYVTGPWSDGNFGAYIKNDDGSVTHVGNYDNKRDARRAARATKRLNDANDGRVEPPVTIGAGDDCDSGVVGCEEEN